LINQFTIARSISLEKAYDIMYFLEGSQLSYPELNNRCVKKDIIIMSGQILCRIFLQKYVSKESSIA